MTATVSVITTARPKARAAAAVAGEGGEGAQARAAASPRRDRNHDFRKPREGAPAEARCRRLPPRARRPARSAREDAGPSAARAFRRQGPGRDERRDKFDRNKGDRNKGGGRDKGERGGRDFGGRDKGGRDKRDSGPSHRQWATSAAPRERDRPVDPNSPFAKLAALKEQLAGNRKE